MGAKSPLNPTLTKAIQEFQRATRIQQVIVIGSHATAQAGPDSDVDLVLIDPRFEGIKSFRRARGLHKSWSSPQPVDFLCYTPEEFERLRDRPTVVREAAQHGILIEA